MNAAKPLKLRKSSEVKFSGSGALLVTLARDVVVWNVQSQTKRFRAHPFKHPSNCSIHPDDSQLVVKNTAGQIALLDVSDGRLVRMLNQDGENEGSNIVHSACGNYLVDGSWNGMLTVRSSQNGEVAFQQAFPGDMLTHIARSRLGNKWYVLHWPKARADDQPPPPSFVTVWDWPLAAATDHLTMPVDHIYSIELSTDGSQLCLLGTDSVDVMRLIDKQIMASTTYEYGGTRFAAAWSPDGEEIVTVQKDGFVFRDVGSLKPVRRIDLPFASDVAYSSDGRLIALGSWTGGMLVERQRT